MKKIISIFCMIVLCSCNGQSNNIRKTENSSTSSKGKTQKNNTNTDKTQFLKINCSNSQKVDDTYNLMCEKFSISNATFDYSASQYELITLDFDDIQKAIIRKVGNGDLPTSSPFVYFNKYESSYIFLFPLIGESNFGWIVYYYKNYTLHPIGQRITYWNSEYESSKINYGDFAKIYKSDDKITVAIPNKYILKSDDDYQNYPDYLEGFFYEKDNIYYFEFSYSEKEYYKKYKNGNYQGDYNKMINNKIINAFQ